MPKKPIRVSQLNAYLARLIAADSVLSDVAVTGEISNFKLHGSGHVFFSLKDESSRIECFLPAGLYRGLEKSLSDGAEVVAEGYVNVYEKGGRYSLTIRRLSAAGRGDLAFAFEQLKNKLAEKGYFDERRKKPLPFFPLAIAIVTSGTGAAVSDMIKTITTRNSVADILVFPTLVQGEGAAGMIAGRIYQINRDYPDTDVMIVGRGGGSAEDLAAFNEEAVADAIYNSAIPVISAVGHETDFTIADFVADRRAETPTAAAVLAAPDTAELGYDIDMLYGQMKSIMAGYISHIELKLRANNMDALIGKLKSNLAERRTYTDSVFSGIQAYIRGKTMKEQDIDFLLYSVKNAVNEKMNREKSRLGIQAGKLEALDPLRVLARGYAIIEDSGGKAVRRAGDLQGGQNIRARFSDGFVSAEVREVKIGE